MILRKRLFYLFIVSLLLVGYGVMAQKQLKIGTNSNNMRSSAVLELDSTTKGFLPPRMSAAQKAAIVSPMAGLQIWCTDCGSSGQMQFYNGSLWSVINTLAGGSAVAVQSGDGVAICDGTRATVVVELTSTTGKIWMDRNLGASRAATSYNDYLAYGCMYQWGRGNDGHASIKWTAFNAGTSVNGTTNVMSVTDAPGHGLFVVGTATDWRNPQNNGLWQAGTQINNPCDAGFRVPTAAEYSLEVSSNNISNIAQAWSNGNFKFTANGWRANNGSFMETGS